MLKTLRQRRLRYCHDSVTTKIDPAVVLATRKYVDDKTLELKVYVDDQMAAPLRSVGLTTLKNNHFPALP